MPASLPPLPPDDDGWPPRRPEDMARYSSQQLVIRARRLCDELGAIIVELDRRDRAQQGGVQ